MKVPLFQTYLLSLRYTGTESIHTVAVDADGGTSAGLITITIGTTANAFDLGDADYDTLTELVDAINALDDVDCQIRGTSQATKQFSDIDLTGDDKFLDLAATDIGRQYSPFVKWAACTAANDRALVPTTAAQPLNACPVLVRNPEEGKVTIQVTVSGGGSGDTTLLVSRAALPTINSDLSVTPLSFADFEDQDNDSLVVAYGGTGEVTELFEVEVGTAGAICVVSTDGVTSAGTVSAYVIKG